MAPRRAQHCQSRRKAGTARLLRQCRLRQTGLGKGLPEPLGPGAFGERGERGLALRREQAVGGLLDQARRLVAHRPLT